MPKRTTMPATAGENMDDVKEAVRVVHASSDDVKILMGKE